MQVTMASAGHPLLLYFSRFGNVLGPRFYQQVPVCVARVFCEGLDPINRNAKEYFVVVAQDKDRSAPSSLLFIRNKRGVGKAKHHAVIFEIDDSIIVSVVPNTPSERIIEISPANGQFQATSLALGKYTIEGKIRLAGITGDAEVLVGEARSTSRSSRSFDGKTRVETLTPLFHALVDNGASNISRDISVFPNVKQLLAKVKELMEDIGRSLKESSADDQSHVSKTLHTVSEAVCTEIQYLSLYQKHQLAFSQVLTFLTIAGGPSDVSVFQDRLREVVAELDSAFLQSVRMLVIIQRALSDTSKIVDDDAKRVAQLTRLVMDSAEIMKLVEGRMLTCGNNMTMLTEDIRKVAFLQPFIQSVESVPDARKLNEFSVLAMQRLTRRTMVFDGLVKAFQSVKSAFSKQQNEINEMSARLRAFAIDSNENIAKFERDMGNIARLLSPATNVNEDGRICLFRDFATLTASGVGISDVKVVLFVFNDCIVTAKGDSNQCSLMTVVNLRAPEPNWKCVYPSDSSPVLELILDTLDTRKTETYRLGGDTAKLFSVLTKAQAQASTLPEMVLPQREKKRSVARVAVNQVIRFASPGRQPRPASPGPRQVPRPASPSFSAFRTQQGPSTPFAMRSAAPASMHQRPNLGPSTSLPLQSPQARPISTSSLSSDKSIEISTNNSTESLVEVRPHVSTPVTAATGPVAARAVTVGNVVGGVATTLFTKATVDMGMRPATPVRDRTASGINLQNQTPNTTGYAVPLNKAAGSARPSSPLIRASVQTYTKAVQTIRAVSPGRFAGVPIRTPVPSHHQSRNDIL